MLTRPEFIEKVGSKYSELRFYEKRGLLVPDDIDEKSRRHYYSENAVKVYFYIQRLQQIGYSLDEIQAHLEETDGMTDAEFYAKREKVLLQQIESLNAVKTEQPVRIEPSKKRYGTPVAKKMKE